MNVLRWFGHVERMDNEQLLKKAMNVKVDGRSARGRPRFGWMDGVKRALNDRRMDMREASERARNGNEWRMTDTVLIGICCCHGVALWRQSCGKGSRGDEIYGVTQVVEDRGGWAVLLQQCHPNSAGSSSLLEERSKTAIVFVFSCCRLPPN